MAQGQQESVGLFALLGQALDRLSDVPETDLRVLLLWYETHLLRQAGLLPDLRTCPHCHPAERMWLRFSLPSGRLACPHLAKYQPGEATLPLHRAVRGLFLLLSDAPQFETAARALSDQKIAAGPIFSLAYPDFLVCLWCFISKCPRLSVVSLGDARHNTCAETCVIGDEDTMKCAPCSA
jgi:recombinational DNA repair protein (RecF pathway)